MAFTSIQPGHKSGGLTVIRLHHRQPKGKSSISYFECLCECGNTCVLRSDRLTGRGPFPATHCQSFRNHPSRFSTHNMSRTPEYRARIAILSRCYDTNRHYYSNYGGRGIKVCDRWRNSFEAFFQDMGPRPSPMHSIERIDNDGDYQPSNARWATKLDQQRNTRHNHYVTFNDETLCISEWASRLTISHAALAKRIKRWGIERALTTPKQTEHDHGAAVRRRLQS